MYCIFIFKIYIYVFIYTVYLYIYIYSPTACSIIPKERAHGSSKEDCFVSLSPACQSRPASPSVRVRISLTGVTHISRAGDRGLILIRDPLMVQSTLVAFCRFLITLPSGISRNHKICGLTLIHSS